MAGKDMPVSPLALPLPEVPPIAGVRLGVVAAGIRYVGRADLTMMEFAPGTTVAGVFTRNKCPGAPVDWCRQALKGGKARALVVNAGNANVFTGKAGGRRPRPTAAAAAGLVGCKPARSSCASTGVIGETLPNEKLTAALPGAACRAGAGTLGRGRRGIMTTDTFPKAAMRTAVIGERHGDHRRHRQGQRHDRARHGDHAGFVATDAKIPAEALQALLSKGDGRRPSTASPSTATPRPATRCCSSPPARPKHPRVPRTATRRLKDFPRGA